MNKNVELIVSENIDIKNNILGVGRIGGENKYLKGLKSSYIRTINDVDELFCGKKKEDIRVLEIGAFFGVVSISMKKLGYDVTATEIPEFCESKPLRTLYEESCIKLDPLNLKRNFLPYESNSFDVVILCEVLEHLNFNPLPIIKEINRVLKKDGYLYVGTPNAACILNRIKMFFGKSVNNSIDDFFDQLNKNVNMIVGIHWREYTMFELDELLCKMGFNVINKYSFNHYVDGEIFKNLMKKILSFVPSFSQSLVFIAAKKELIKCDFWITDANSF